jgi:hypothetical protein
MNNSMEIQVIVPYIVWIVVDRPEVLIPERIIIGSMASWVIGAPTYLERPGWRVDIIRR